MANSYHMEALRKQRMIDRKNEAIARLDRQRPDQLEVTMENSSSKRASKETVINTDAGQSDQQRFQLPMFRVNEEGFQNRYRHRQHFSPHCDKAFCLLYPGSDNTDYTCNENKTNRRKNIMSDKYDIACKVNGEFHVSVLEDTPQ